MKTHFTISERHKLFLESITSSEGSLHLPLAVAFFLTVLTGFSIWGFMRHWRFMVQTQLRLDKCVGSAAHGFRDKLNSLESSNQKIKDLRATLIVTPPQVSAPLRAALQALAMEQDLMLAAWQIKRTQWAVIRGCGQLGDLANPLPALSFARDFPDALGPKPLTWEGKMPEEFHFEASHSPRIAAANVEAAKIGTEGKENHVLETLSGRNWKAAWSPPARFKRTNFY